MSARRELLLAALTERSYEGTLTPEVAADAVEETLRDLPTVPYLAVLRLAYQPDGGEIPKILGLADELKAEGAVGLIVVSDDVQWETLDDEDLLKCGLQRVALVHRVPRDGEGVTPCCGKTPFELPRDERVTEHDGVVTCRGDNYCTRHGQARWRCRTDKPAGSCIVGDWPS